MEKNAHLDSYEVTSALRDLDSARSRFLDDVYMFGVVARRASTNASCRENKAAMKKIKSLENQCQKLKEDMLAKESANFEARKEKEQKLQDEKWIKRRPTIYIFNEEVRKQKQAAIEDAFYNKVVKLLCTGYKKEQAMFENASAKVKGFEARLKYR